MPERHWIVDYLPRKLPSDVRLIERRIDGAAYLCAHGLSVIASGDTEADGKRWLHVSCAHRRQLPTWEELRWVKETFVGDRYAVQEFPPPDRYVNIHPYCLHLFACLDEWPLPEFSGLVGGMRSV